MDLEMQDVEHERHRGLAKQRGRDSIVVSTSIDELLVFRR